jgi:SAM-dependent methyltransferase
MQLVAKQQHFSNIFVKIFLFLACCLIRDSVSFVVITLHNKKNAKKNNTSGARFMVKTNFDFSSAWAWEQFYKESDEPDRNIEWHNSIPLDDIAKLIAQQQPVSSVKDSDLNPVCLMVGCGTSELPMVVRRMNSSLDLLLLDSSPTCIDILKIKYHDDPAIQCICEDATRLESMGDQTVDMVLDKGLLDALFCSEGWNGPVEKALQAASRVLKHGGKYILIGYKQPTSTLDFMKDAAPNLDWKSLSSFSNDRVSVSVATKLEIVR